MGAVESGVGGVRDMDWEEKKDIIKKYNENVPIKEIAKTYNLTSVCVYKRLERWDIKKRSGIRYLLGKMILELLF